MRRRTTILGLIAAALAVSAGPRRATADFVTKTQEQTFGFTQTDYGALNAAGDPLTFLQFKNAGVTNPDGSAVPANAILTGVDVTFKWGFQNQITLTYATGGQESVTAFGGITLANPNANISGPSPSAADFMFPTQTFTNTFSATGTAGQTLSSGSPAGTPTTFISGQNGYAAPLSKSFTSPGDLQAFSGSGTVGFQVVATAGSDFYSSSGNGQGTSLTYAFPDVTLTYHYMTPIPEPSSVLLMGMGAGLLFYCRRRRRA